MKRASKVIVLSIFVVTSALAGCGVLKTNPNDARKTTPNQSHISGQSVNNTISPVGNQAHGSQ